MPAVNCSPPCLHVVRRSSGLPSRTETFLSLFYACPQVSEAEAMAAGGIQDIFISNEVVAPSKIDRLVALAAQGKWGPASCARLWGLFQFLLVLCPLYHGHVCCKCTCRAAAATRSPRAPALPSWCDCSSGSVVVYHQHQDVLYTGMFSGAAAAGQVSASVLWWTRWSPCSSWLVQQHGLRPVWMCWWR